MLLGTECRRVEGPDPRWQRNDVRLPLYARKTLVVWNIVSQLKRRCKMSKNEQNELKLLKVNKSQFSGREKVKESQSPGKGVKLREKHT